MWLLALQHHRIWTIGLISTKYSTETSRLWLHNKQSTSERKHHPNPTNSNNVIISQWFFFNSCFSCSPSQLAVQHFLSYYSFIATTSPFFLPSFICEHPVFCLWKWTAQSRCSPASTPPIFRLLLATTKYLRTRRVRTRVPLHRSYPNIPQCLWLCATVQRTRTI